MRIYTLVLYMNVMYRKRRRGDNKLPQLHDRVAKDTVRMVVLEPIDELNVQFLLCSICGPTGSSPRARDAAVAASLLSDLLDATRSAERVPRARLRLSVMSYKNILRKRYTFAALFLWTYGESNPDLFHAMEPFYRYTIGPH
jgi:hypothetical protein